MNTDAAVSVRRASASALALRATSAASTFACWSVMARSEEHTSELQSLRHLVCRLLLEKKNNEHRSKPRPHTDTGKAMTMELLTETPLDRTGRKQQREATTSVKWIELYSDVNAYTHLQD